MINKFINPANWVIPGKRWLSARRLFSLVWFKTKRHLKLDYSFWPPKPSTTPLDVFMPVIEKDGNVLPMAIESIRKYVQHPVGDIYLVAPKDSKTIAKVAKDHNCVFVAEEEALPISKKDINYTVDGQNRSGWIYKMLLNLSADTICKNRYILVLDADTQFIAPQIFVYKNKPLFNLSNEYHQPYFDANYKLLGLRHRLSRSFITHYMLFDAEVLQSLRKNIEQRWSKDWYQAIIDCIDKRELSGFADYEVYGDYYMLRSGKPYILNYWSNKSLYLDSLKPGEDYIKVVQDAVAAHASTHRSVSLHNYLG